MTDLSFCLFFFLIRLVGKGSSVTNFELIVIYWSFTGQQIRCWKLLLSERAGMWKPLLENFSEWNDACRASARQLGAHSALNQLICQLTLCSAVTNWAVYISCCRCSPCCSVSVLFAASCAFTPHHHPCVYLQVLFIYGSSGGCYWSFPALALAG